MAKRKNMLTIRLPKNIEERPEKISKATGRTKTFYVREAILDHLDEVMKESKLEG